MLMIRSEQIAALGEYMLRQFEARMHHALRADFPAESVELSDEELGEIIREGVERAEGYAVTDETDVERFLELMLRRGRTFDLTESWANEILTEADLSGTQKMDKIDDYELFVLEEGIAGGGVG